MLLEEENKIEVLLRDTGGHNGAANGGDFGLKRILYSTSPEKIKILDIDDKNTETSGRLTFHQYLRKIKIELDASWSEKDVLFAESFRHNQMNGIGRDTIDVILGDKSNIPDGFMFPERYSEFVHDEANRHKAISFLYRWNFRNGKPITYELNFAQRKSAKNTILSAWEDMIKVIEKHTKRNLKIKIPNSWTGAHSLPIKISKRLGCKYPNEPKYVKDFDKKPFYVFSYNSN